MFMCFLGPLLTHSLPEDVVRWPMYSSGALGTSYSCVAGMREVSEALRLWSQCRLQGFLNHIECLGLE